MKIVVSLQKQPKDDRWSRPLVNQKIKALTRRCLELMEEWPESEWMTQTYETKPRAGKE